MMTNGMRYHRCCLPSSTSTRKRQRQSTKRPTRTAVSGGQVDTQAVCANRRSAPRTAAAGDSPRRLRGSPASAQLAVHCRRPARLRTTTAPRRGSVAAMLPHWSHGDRRLPDGRLTRPLPPPVKGHGRDAWCEYRSGLAGGRWELNGSRVYPGRPTGIAFGSARARADTALANSEADRRALPARPGEARPPSTALPRARDAELEAVIVGVAVRPVRGVGTGRAPDRAENTTLYTWRFFSLPRP